MNKKLSFDKFKYFFISIDIFKEKINLSEWKYKNLDKDKYVTFFHPNDHPSGIRMIKPLENITKRKEFSEIYVDFNKFLDDRLVTTYGKLDSDSVKKLSDKDWDYFKKLQRDLVNNWKNVNIIKDKYSSIFLQQTDKVKNYVMITEPSILYMEPYDGNLFSYSKKQDLFEKVRNVAKMLNSHGSLWSVIDNYILMTLLHTEYPWRSLIFINTKPLPKSKNAFEIPDFLHSLIKLIACYHWLIYRNNQIIESNLSKFNQEKLILDKKLREIMSSNQEILSSLGEFNDINITLLDELPDFKEFNSRFTNYIMNANILEPGKEYFLGDTTKDRLINELTNVTNNLEYHIDKLKLKAQIITNHSRDNLNSKISSINIRLQYILGGLTITLSIFTILLYLKEFGII